MTDKENMPNDPFEGRDFTSGEVPDFLLDIVQKAARGHVREHAIDRMAKATMQAIRACMEQEGRNLNGAIESTRILMEKDREMTPRSPEVLEVELAGIREGITRMRRCVNEAYALVRLDSAGVSEPVPYDEKEHLEALADTLDHEKAVRGFLAALGVEPPDGL